MFPRSLALLPALGITLALALPAAADPSRTEEVGPKERPARTDRFSDPLPPGAVARLGTVRLHHSWCVAFAPDGKTLVTAERRTVRLWDAATGKELRQLRVQLEDFRWITFLALSPDGRKLAMTDDLGVAIEVWDLNRKKPLLSTGLPGRNGGHVLRTCGMVFSPDGKTLYAGNDETVHSWDLEAAKELFHVRHSDGKRTSVNTIALAPGGKCYATACDWNTVIHLWETRSGKLLHTLKGPEEHGIICVAFSSDGALLATGGYDDTVRPWDVKTGKEVRKLGGHRAQVVAVAFTPDGKNLAAASNAAMWSSASGEQAIRIWDLGDREKQPMVIPAPDVRDPAFSPDGKTLAWICCNQSVRLLDRATGKEVNPRASHSGEVAAVAFSPRGDQIATGGADHTIRLWEADTGKQVRVLTGHTDTVYALAFSPDGKLLVSTSRDGTAAFWDVATGRIRFRSDYLRNEGRAVAFAPDGKTVAVGSYTGRFHVWDVASVKEVRVVKEESASPSALAYSPDGRILACGGRMSVRLRDAATDKLLRTLSVENGVTSLAFSPDGKTLALGCNQHSILWEMATGKERARLPGHRNERGSVAFSPDGRLLASGSWDRDDRSTRVWDLAAVAREAPPAPADRPALDGKPPGPKELGAAWSDLASGAAAAAYRAARLLMRSPKQAAAHRRRHLRPAAAPSGEQLAALLAGLDNDSYEARQKASAALANLGELAEPAPRKKLAAGPSAEARRRISALLARLADPLSVPPAEELRGLRAVEVLERIGTSEAKALLERLAGGAPTARLTRDAKAALERLAKCPVSR